MRKQNKIVSLVLVVALLLGVFVVIPNSPAVASAAEGESFTPNMTVTVQEQSSGNLTTTGNANIKNAALAATPGMLTGFSGSKATPFDYAVVNAGDDSFAMFAPNLTGNYGTDSQITFTQANTDIANTDWYVVEFDIASDSAFPTGFYFSVPLRNKSADGKYNGSFYYFAESVQLDKHVAADGAWHHVAAVGDLNTQNLYFYVDGVLADTYMSAGNGPDSIEQGYKQVSLYHTGVKFSNPAGLAAELGQTAYIDNVSNRIITGDDIAALSAAVTAGTITSWSGYQTPKGGKLPAMAKLDGKEVYNSTDLNAALNGLFPVSVEMLHDTRAKLTVNVDATVKVNGLANNIVAGTNVTATANGTVTTYDAPHKSTVTEAHRPSNNAIKGATADSTTTRIDLSANYADTTADHWLVTDALTGNQYLDIRPGASFSTSDATHNHWNWITNNTTYQAGKYFVIDFDTYTESEVMKDLYIGVTSRNSGGSNKGGAGLYIKNWNLPIGEWAHVTFVCDLDNNVLYAYVNGAWVYTQTSGVYNADGTASPAKGGYFQGIRVNVATQTNMTANQNFAIDNVKYSMNIESAWLDSNIGAKSLIGSDIYDADYVLPSIPVLALVDGETVNTPAELSAMLVGNTAKNVEIFRPYKCTVTVNCDAVINTNGYTAPVAGANVTRTNDGNVYTYDAPYMESLIMSEQVTSYVNSNLVNVLKADVAGNLFNAMQWDSTMTGQLHTNNTGMNAAGYIGTNTFTGDNYVIYDGTVTNADGIGVNDTSNSYYEIHSKTKITYDASKNQYMVYDFDFAQLSEGTVPLMVVPRFGGSGQWGAKNPSLTEVTAGCEFGEFNHFTFVYDMNANTLHVFVNGSFFQKYENGVSTNTVMTDFKGGTVLTMDGLRFGSNSTAIFATDNVAIRHITEAVGTAEAGSLTTALAANSISAWTNAITEAESETAPLAIVDGEYVNTAAQLSAALNGRKVKNVEIIRSETAAITVNCDAVIETNGLNVNLVAGTDVTVTTNGTVKTYDAPWKASATESTASNGNFIIDASVPGNLFSGRTGVQYVNNGDGKMAMYQVTDVETGNTYLKLVPTTDGVTGANIYLTTEIIAAPGNTTADCVLKDGEGYYVYDLDIAADAEIIKALNFAPSARNNASEGSTFPFPEGFNIGDKLGDNDVTGGEWLHLTVVGDMAANKQYLFVNGTLTAEVGKANKEAGKYEYLNVKGYRLNLDAAAVISTDESILVDNIACRVYKSVSETNGLDTALAAGSLTDWTYHVNGIGGEKLPAIATVDGTEYYGATELTEALASGKNHNVVIDRPVTGYVYASSTATVISNNLKNFIKGANGYNVIDNGDGTFSIVVETRMGTIVVKINGSEAIRQSVLYGTNIADFLNRNNSYVLGVIAADNGAVYTGAKWDVTPAGIVDRDEVVYNVTATKLDSDFVVLKNDGTVDTSRTTLDDFLANDASTDRTIVLAKNVTLEKGNYPIVGNRTLYLNGNSITFNAANGGAHALQLAGNAYNVTFVGGNIIDNVRSNTQAIFFAGYDFGGELKLVDCDVYAVANIGNVRGGTFTFENCNINVLESQNTAAFVLTEYYKAGYTYLKVTLNLIDTDVRFVHATHDRSEPMISIKDYTQWGEKTEANEQAAIAKGYDKVVHEINISGSSFYNGFKSSVIRSTTNNVNINIEASQFNVKNVFADGVKGNVTIGKNVLSAVQLSNLGAGIVEVNSGNPVAPYLYTDEYATVVWADGTTELWADGTYPVNAKYNKANVPMVEAGNTYNIGENADVAISMKANLTLDANLKLNVYVPTTVNLTAFNMGGVAYDVAAATIVKIGEADFYHFVFEMAPHLATGDFTVAATVGTTTVTKSIDLVEYAKLVIAQYADDQNAQNLVKSVLTYVAAAGKHMGAYTQGYDATNSYADATALTVDSATAVNTMANVNAYLTGAALDLNAAPAWVFTVASGADLSGLTVTVDGKAVEYTVVGNKLVVELPAYDMLDTITVEIDGVSGQYNFAAYYTAMKTLADSIDMSTTSWKANALLKEAEAEFAMQLLDAFYSYASYAAAYK